MKSEFEIQDVITEVLTSSMNYGRQFGGVRNLPCSCNNGQKHLRQSDCINENCHGVMVNFRHDIDTSYSDTEVTFLWNPELNRFRLTGEYCPVCDYSDIEINGETVKMTEGKL